MILFLGSVIEILIRVLVIYENYRLSYCLSRLYIGCYCCFGCF